MVCPKCGDIVYVSMVDVTRVPIGVCNYDGVLVRNHEDVPLVAIKSGGDVLLVKNSEVKASFSAAKTFNTPMAFMRGLVED